MRQNICHPITHTHTADRLHYPDHKVVGNNKKIDVSFITEHKTSLCSASFLGCQHVTARICCRAPLPACYRSVTRARGALSSKPPLLLWIDGTDRQTDARSFYRPCCAYSAAASINTDAHVVKIICHKYEEIHHTTRYEMLF